ncbi:MAG: LysM domain-containing protein [Polyangiaceae bacterium]
MVDYKSVVVRDGDTLDKIAYRTGVGASDIWSFEKNAELAAKREPSVLLPGDVIYHPIVGAAPEPVEAGASNDYSAKVPTVELHCVLCDSCGLLKDTDYVAEIDGPDHVIEGKTDNEGRAILNIPILTSEIVFRMEPITRCGPAPTITLKVGHLDPPESTSGQRSRLSGLGLYPVDRARWPASDADDPALAEALVAFRAAYDLDGQPDDVVFAKLVEAFGA